MECGVVFHEGTSLHIPNSSELALTSRQRRRTGRGSRCPREDGARRPRPSEAGRQRPAAPPRGSRLTHFAGPSAWRQSRCVDKPAGLRGLRAACEGRPGGHPATGARPGAPCAGRFPHPVRAREQIPPQWLGWPGSRAFRGAAAVPGGATPAGAAGQRARWSWVGLQSLARSATASPS